ncbi:hypothetical protein QBC41DRAFT_371846 [Cercophora samala]|uniref:Uncharacterized protein n=1 Tax=Cercophora samala TaxID=330535 RepID=A0AA40DCJ1_9PEZI|nr:hypothetical protein QBC41DRAFT_371846 [Cercophora samala]
MTKQKLRNQRTPAVEFVAWKYLPRSGMVYRVPFLGSRRFKFLEFPSSRDLSLKNAIRTMYDNDTKFNKTQFDAAVAPVFEVAAAVSLEQRKADAGRCGGLLVVDPVKFFRMLQSRPELPAWARLVQPDVFVEASLKLVEARKTCLSRYKTGAGIPEGGLIAKAVDRFLQVDSLNWDHPSLTEFSRWLQEQGRVLNDPKPTDVDDSMDVDEEVLLPPPTFTVTLPFHPKSHLELN